MFDATPLAENADAELIATTLLADLLNQSPLPADNIAAIDARPGLKPLVRRLVLEQIQQQGLNADRIAEQCRKVLVNRYGSPPEFQRALRWAEALHQIEPDALRTRVLLGAANVRCGNFEKAIEILKDRPDDLKQTRTMKDWSYQRERLVMLLVARIDSGAPAQIYGSVLSSTLHHNIRRPAAVDLPDQPAFSPQEGIESVPLSTKLFYMPGFIHAANSKSNARFVSFLRTLLLPYL